MTKIGIGAVVLVAACAVEVYRVHSTEMQTANAQTVESRRKTFEERQAASLAETNELLEEIADGIEKVWKSNSPGNHRITINRLAHAYSDLGLDIQYHALNLTVQLLNDKQLKKSVPDLNSMKRDALLYIGEYQTVFDNGGTSTSKANQLMSVVNAAISAGNLREAEKLLLQAMKKSADGKQKLSGSWKQSLLLGNANIAVAAHYLDKKEFVEPALRRYRALMQDQTEISESSISKENNWIKPTDQFARQYIFTLASSGHSDLAEKLWLEFFSPDKSIEKKNDKLFAWLTSPQGAMEFCCRLALAGQEEQAIRIARRFNHGEIPTNVLHALCLWAATKNYAEKLNHYSGLYLKSIESLSFPYFHQVENSNRPLSDDAVAVDKLAHASHHLLQFIQDMSDLDQNEICKDAATLYLNLANRYAKEFESRLKVADVHALRAARRDHYPYEVDAVFDFLTTEQLEDFRKPQRSFLWRNKEFFRNSYSTYHGSHLNNHLVAYSKMGLKPEDHELRTMGTGLLSKVVDHLLAAGKPEEAKKVFAIAAKKALQMPQASFVSGSAGGRVVNGTTQSRYLAVQIAAKLNDVDKAIEILEKIEFKGARIDGYRVLAETLSVEVGMEPALAWANSLDDADYQLAARVGILGIRLKELNTFGKPSAVDQHLKRVGRYGYMLLIWGC